MNLAFDLTTPEGRKNAIDAFDKYGWILAWPTWLIRHAYKVMTEGAIASTEAQKNAAVDLIRAGRDHGVDKMTIKLQRTAGIDLGSEVDGIPIKLKVEDSGTVEIAVQYRDGRRFDLPGDADSDWREAKQQLLSESSELSGRSTITTEELIEIPARTEEIALPAEVTSAETEVAPIEEGQPVSHEAYRKAEPGGELPPLTESVFESPVEPAVEQTAETVEPSVLQTPEIAPALAAVPMPPEAVRLTEPSDEETLEIPGHTEEIAVPAVVMSAETEVGSMQTSVQLTFSFEIADMQLTPTFKIGVLKVQPISKIVTMRLAPSQQAQPEMSFEIAKIQPVGETLGTIRLTRSQQQRPMMGSPSFMAAGLQVVPTVEPTPAQFEPSEQGQAAVFVTVPCRITRIEFSPSLEIASVVLNSSSKQVLVQLGGAGPRPADRPMVFEIADLQLSEGGNAGMIQLNLLGQNPTEVLIIPRHIIKTPSGWLPESRN